LISGPEPPPIGGIATVIQHLFESDLGRRFELARFSSTRARFRPTPVTQLANRALARGLGLDGSFNLEARAKLAAWSETLDQVRPDLVHLHSSHGYDFWLSARMARMAQRRGIRAIQHVHGNFDIYHPTWSFARRAVFRRALAVPDRFVVLSESWKRWFSRHMDPARIDVLYNCVDMHRFTPREKPARAEVRALFVGTRDATIKGLYDLLAVVPEVVRAVPALRFVLLGNDAEDVEARLVRGTPLAEHVRFEGLKTVDEITSYFEDADFLLLPSHMEGMPMALLEAMAAGIPVVASGINSIPEVLPDPEGGALIAPGDRPALARAIVALARDPERRRRAGQANRARVESRFDRARHVETLAAIYERVLGRGSPRGA
jgi:glycosyltransferase involved in cell wall biosynthesis